MLHIWPQRSVHADDRIGIIRAHGELHVVALTAFAPGERIMNLAGAIAPTPSRYSVQVGLRQHVEVPAADRDDFERVLERYPWRFLNHSCDPSARVDGRELLALRPIARWDEITFDYDTTEFAMAAPFACRCGACAGRTVAGFAALGPAERERLAPLLAPHLRAMHAGGAQASGGEPRV